MDARLFDQPPTCPLCRADLDHCHEASVEHADGRTECLDPTCGLPHAQHGWQFTCSIFDPPCPCSPDEADQPAVFAEPLVLAAA
jgi:hypothetical protein